MACPELGWALTGRRLHQEVMIATGLVMSTVFFLR